MSKYTTMIRYIVETYTYGSTKSIRERIVDACPSIFDFHFPIFDESHRIVLEEKIVKHYFLREIGLETVGLWKLMLDERMNLIMPSYNIMYENTANFLNIFNTLDYWEKVDSNSEMHESSTYGNEMENNYNGKVEDTNSQDANSSQNTRGSSHNSSSGSGNTKSLESDLPQINYAGMDYGTKLIEGENSNTSTADGTTDSSDTVQSHVAGSSTSVQENNQIATTNSKNQVGRTNIDDRIRHIAGRQGGDDLAGLLMKYKDSVMNIDAMIVHDIADLFMQVY